jgi:hypothetical protein
VQDLLRKQLTDFNQNGYNSAARLNSVVSSRTGTNLPPNLLSTVKYNAFGGVVSDSLGDGETETFGYD